MGRHIHERLVIYSCSARERIRTSGLTVRSRLLYPLSYAGSNLTIREEEVSVKRTTRSFCSGNWPAIHQHNGRP